jgi:succinate dehydrogenase / fumarate reductase, flavoprotein subunit
MGGVIANERMETALPGLYVAGEAVGGANGANRLSGNAITEALVFGRRAGRSAAAHAMSHGMPAFRAEGARAALDLIASASDRCDINTAEMIVDLQATMADDVGPFRTEAKLERAAMRIDELKRALGERPIGDGKAFDIRTLDWFDLRNMLGVAGLVTWAALERTESRGAHQREDFPGMLPEWRVNQVAELDGGEVRLTRRPVALEAAAQ